MKIIPKISIYLVFTVLCVSNSFSREKTMSIYSSVSYEPHFSLSKHSLKPQIGVGLDFRKNRYIRFDNKLGVIWYQTRRWSIKNWVDENGVIVRTDTTHYKNNYLGLAYSFIPSLILWDKLIIGCGACAYATTSSADFGFEVNSIAKIGYKFKIVEIHCSIISDRQIGAGLSIDLSSRVKKTTVGQN